MKKKVIIISIIVILIIICIILLITYGLHKNKNSNYEIGDANIIYSYYLQSHCTWDSYSKKIEIYSNGVIITTYRDSSKDNKYNRKLSNTDLNNLKSQIEKVENSNLEQEKTEGLGAIIRDTEEVEEYINLNKKMIIQNNDVIYTNEEIKELNDLLLLLNINKNV